jgi:glycosidase
VTFKDDKVIVDIPAEAKQFNRSWIRIWSSNEYGQSNDVLIPLTGSMVVNKPDQLTRHDWESTIFYFLMIDRFNNGTPTNDFPVDDPEILPKANHFGGDLVGITDKIKDGYFQDLGINTIWLSPITQNPLEAYGLWPEPRSRFSGYHGYWPISLTKVDFRFGKESELIELIQTAHENDMNIVLDFVANHVHEKHPLYIKHPEWATELYLPDGTLNTEKWDEYRLTTWFDTHLPTLDLENPEVTNLIADSAVFWIKEYNMDGFRHDATKHIPEIFWRTLTKKLKNEVMIPENKRIYQVGETYGNRELIGSYINTGMLDAQFDFGVYDASVSVFAKDNEPFELLIGSLNESLNHYGYHNVMNYISGNQDKPRFISLAGGAVKFDEDSKLAGWTREIGVGELIAYKKLQSLIAFNMTIPGIPTIYYGDEYGMPGANDPDNRRMMKFDDLSPEEFETREITKKLINLRRSNLALTFGNFEVLHLDKYTMAYMRTYLDHMAIVIFNKSKKPIPVKLNIPERYTDLILYSNFGSEINPDGMNLTAIIEGNTFEVVTVKN